MQHKPVPCQSTYLAHLRCFVHTKTPHSQPSPPKQLLAHPSPTTAPTSPPVSPTHPKGHGLRCPGSLLPKSGCITTTQCMWRTYLDTKLGKIPPHNLCVGKVEHQGVANQEVPRPIILVAFSVVGGAAPNFPGRVSNLSTWGTTQPMQSVLIAQTGMHAYAPIPLLSSSSARALEVRELQHNFWAATPRC